MPRRAANLSDFKAEEVSLIDQVVVDISGLSATQVSDISHKFPAWQVAQDKEPLPLYTFLITSRVPTEDDIKQAQSQLNDVQGCEE